jgi:serine/threonine protein kinase
MNLDQVRELIVSGQLLSAERFDEFQQGWLDGNRKPEEGAEFIRWLVDERELTEFQGKALLAGIPGPYLLGPYRVTARVTAGRLGDVYHAEHVEFQQPVSLKVFPAALNQDPELAARLGREARVSLQVDSPHVVKTYQVGRVGSIPFIALESLQGETLQQRLDREGRIPQVEACQLIQQAALGLAYIHSQEIIHRDICPANLWISDQGVVKIMEFGAARDALSFVDSLGGDGDDLTIQQAGGDLLGHYAYMSAQQAEDPHSADVASDLYSLGCTLYHCLTGQVPFPDKNPVRQMLRHANEPPRPLADFDPEIPQVVQDVVTYLLEKRPEDRYGSADEVAAALAAIIPLAALPAMATVAPDFLDWVSSIDVDDLGAVVEEPREPELQQFVTWLAEHQDDSDED